MNQDTVSHLATRAMILTLEISAPFLIAGLAVGLLISIIQAATQIQEPTLSFIPKIIATGAVIAIGGPWMLSQIVGYTTDLYLSIPTLVGS
ncbi:MAG TPA: flagellar biosynthesis protein FliQ [Gaiellales bacterium]|jgi:flagellar biosynthetic protein FliQ